MLIQIDKLKRRPRQIKIDEQATSFPAVKDLIEEGMVLFSDKIEGACEAVWAGDVIEVTGSLTTQVTSPCCRCLKPVDSVLDVTFELSYTSDDIVDASDAEEIEIQSEEIGLIPYTGPEIDLRPDIEQEIIMALPQQPLCQETCRGLCPVCGCDLNLTKCDCEQPVLHAGLAALKNFKVKQ